MRAALVPYCSACAASIEQGLPAVQPPLGHRCVASDTACAVGDDWAGGMQGQHYPSQGKALEALKAAIAAAKAAPASTWEGEPLYPSCLAAALPPAASPSSAAAASASSSSPSSEPGGGFSPLWHRRSAHCQVSQLPCISCTSCAVVYNSLAVGFGARV